MGTRERIVECAKEYIGVQYKGKYQGTGPEDGGFTCSGLTWRAYHDAGVEIPVCQGIHSYFTGSYNGWETQAGWVLNHGHFTDDEDALEVGDLVFYSPVWDMEQTGHVAIYAGDGMVIHANGAPVSIDPISSGGNFVGGGWPLIELPDDGWQLIPAKGTVVFDRSMNIRTAPSTDAPRLVDEDGNPITYEAGEELNIDGFVLANGYTWAHYVGSGSGKDRFVALSGDVQFAKAVD